MAKLVDAWDLKSPARKGVPVRFRVRAPNKSRACMRFFVQALCFLHRKNSDRSAILDFHPFSWRPANVPKIKTPQAQPNPCPPFKLNLLSARKYGTPATRVRVTTPNAARQRATMSLETSLSLFVIPPASYRPEISPLCSAANIDLNWEIISEESPAPSNTAQVKLTGAGPGAVMIRSATTATRLF